MKLRVTILLAILMALPTLCAAQDSGLNEYVTALQAKCPKTLDGEWELTSVTLDGDTINVDITVSGQSATYLPYMAANATQMKQMWLQQLPRYGKEWNQLITLLVVEEKSLVLTLKAVEGEASATFTFAPADFKVP